MRAVIRPSPNFDERRDGQKPDMIVIHYTHIDSAEKSIERLTDPVAKVSAHYLIDVDGSLTIMVDDDKRAWHAGVSKWRGRDDVNSRSIGIELQNNGAEPFATAQIDALIDLCKILMRDHGIRAENVVGHSDVAPLRKQDPGHLFPWKKLAESGVAEFPKLRLRDFFNAKSIAQDKKKLADLFNQAGYDTTDLGQTVAAFHRRFEPDLFNDKNADPEIPTRRTVMRLKGLIGTRK